MDDLLENGAAAEELNQEDEDSQAVIAIVKLLKHRLDDEEFLNSGDRESVAYRLAEIMMCAKDLYTKRLSCLAASKEERAKMGMLGEDTPREDPEEGAADGEEAEKKAKDITVFEDLAYTRMHLIRMRDLITDFDASFMEAMASQRDEDGNEETWLKEAEWTEEDLEDSSDTPELGM